MGISHKNSLKNLKFSEPFFITIKQTSGYNISNVSIALSAGADVHPHLRPLSFMRHVPPATCRINYQTFWKKLEVKMIFWFGYLCGIL
jgi:hypothetical protein